jgi:hypothetical protein
MAAIFHIVTAKPSHETMARPRINPDAAMTTAERQRPRRRDDEHDFIRWCFAARAIAEAFAAEFSGTVSRISGAML